MIVLGLMIPLEENLIALLEAIEDCLARGRILPCLTLLYSGIDVVASLEYPASTRYTFMDWVDRYFLKSGSLPSTSADLYGARCGVLHSFSAESDFSDQGKARPIVYAWGKARADDLAVTAKKLGRKEIAIDLRELINAFRAGLATYLEEIMQDPNRQQKLTAKTDLWLAHMDQGAIETFLKLANP